jgi:hypothetical protein
MLTNESTPLRAPGGRGLLDLVASGYYQLPEFQRPYRWRSDSAKTCGLLTSIAQGWPAGSLLLMEGVGNFQPVPVETWGREEPEDDVDEGLDEPEVDPSHLILDGQQRLTALYLAYFDRDPKFSFFIHLARLIETGMTFTDDSDADVFLALNEREMETKDWGSLETKASEGVLLVSDFVNSRPWERWKTIAVEDGGFDGELLTEIRDGTVSESDRSLNGLLRYEFPVTTIDEDASDEALAQIFVEINQTSTPLDIFDLVTARTLRTEEPRFNLRDEWIRLSGDPHVARERDRDTTDEPALDFLYRFNLKSGEKKHGETPLKLLALAEIADVNGAEWDRVSLGKGALVGLDPDYVRERFEDAARALDATTRFLNEDERIIPETLPSDNCLLPIAVQFFHHPELSEVSTETRDQRDKLGQWFWAVALRNHYGRGGTQGRVVDETKYLTNWLHNEPYPVPDTVAGFWDEWQDVIKLELVKPKAYRSHVLKAVLALDVYNGARDWIGLRPQGRGQPAPFRLHSILDYEPGSIALEEHHIWPKQAETPLQGDGPESFGNGVAIPYRDEVEKAILNRCLLLKPTNAAVAASPPHAALNHDGVEAANINSYLLNSACESWVELAEDRMTQIERTVRILIPPQ